MSIDKSLLAIKLPIWYVWGMEEKKYTVSSYYPLIVLVVGSFLMASALDAPILPSFMGIFLCQFALLKLYSLTAFATTYAMYDMIAMRIPQWGFVYPFIEFMLGVAYLSQLYAVIAPVVTIVLMGIGAIGIGLSLMRGVDLKCACMGGILDVPLGFVSLFEDLSMIAMAVYMLL